MEEILYPAMEDYELDLVIGEGPAARSVKISLPKFTLVGATTRSGLLTTPLRDRFGIPVRLAFYTVEELEHIVTRGARVLGIGIAPDGASEIAKRARGTPRIAGRLLRRVRDFALVAEAERIDRKIADRALSALEVDQAGLDAIGPSLSVHDRGALRRWPVGIDTMAAALSEPRDALEEIIEPFLVQQGFVQRTPRGPGSHRRGLPASGSRRAQRPPTALPLFDEGSRAFQFRQRDRHEQRHFRRAGGRARRTRAAIRIWRAG